MTTHDKLYRRGNWQINARCSIVGASYSRALAYACYLRRQGARTYAKPILNTITDSYRPMSTQWGEA